MASSNLAVLTKSHKIIASKKKAKREQIKEVVFDDAARRDFLTGFHKRKVQKKEAAKKKAMEREKQERLETRREHRKMLAEQAKKNAEETERAYRGMVDDGAESDWEGLRLSKGKERATEAEEEEYEDEEQLATVTVVEEFDPDSLIHGTQSAGEVPLEDDPAVLIRPLQPRAKSTSAVDTAQTKTRLKVAAKAKDVKYQTNAARRMERQKQRKRKAEKAERAGGKGLRRKGGPKGKR